MFLLTRGADRHDVRHGRQFEMGVNLLATERQAPGRWLVDAVGADGGDAQDVAVRCAAGNEGTADRAAAPRFSTTTVWPSSLLSLSANRRPTMPVMPPGGRNDQADTVSHAAFSVRYPRSAGMACNAAANIAAPVLRYGVVWIP